MEDGKDRFKIPVSFPISSCLDLCQMNRQNARNLLDSTFATSRPTAIEYWHGTDSSCGLIVGCEFGTIYVFRSLSCMDPNLPTSQIESTDPAGAKTSKRKSRRSFGSSSPGPNYLALSPTALSVTPKPRVVSGVTAERVEAPKNYVDFDDEPDKLKDILKGRALREKSISSDTASERLSKSNAPSVIEPVPFSKRKNLLSTTNSRASTPPFPTPYSSREQFSNSSMWVLRYHVIPLRSGFGYAVKSIQILPDAQLFAVLQESGDIYIYSFQDGSCKASFQVDDDSQNQTGNRFERKRPSDVWVWRHLTVSTVGEYVTLIATASWGSEFLPVACLVKGESSETSRCLLLELVFSSTGPHLKKLGQWELEGPAISSNLYAETDGSLCLINASADGYLVIQKVTLNTTNETLGSGQHNGNHAHGHLSIPHAIKSIISGSTDSSNEKASINNAKEEPLPSLSETRSAGPLVEGARPFGMILRKREARMLRGVVWFHQEISVFDLEDGSTKFVLRYPVDYVQTASWLDDDLFALCFKERVDFYMLRRTNTNDGPLNKSEHASSFDLQLELMRSLTVDRYDAIRVTADSVIISRLSLETNQQEIVSYSLRSKLPQDTPDLVWRFVKFDTEKFPSPCSILPIDSDTFVLGYSDGFLREYSLLQLGQRAPNTFNIIPPKRISSSPLRCKVVGLHIVWNPRTREKYLVGGGDDGSISFWSSSTFGLLARWITFITPLAKVIQPEIEKSSPLHGCALCVSRDGTIAAIAIDGFYFLYLVPGYVSPITRICLGGKNLLLIYADQCARLWDSQTKEFWRSMDRDKAEEMLMQDGWTTMFLHKGGDIANSVWSSISDSYDGLDTASSLLLNLEKLVVDSIFVTKTISTNKDQIREILWALDRLKTILSFFITPGLSEDIDSICYGKLGAYTSTAIPGSVSHGVTTLYTLFRPAEVWCISEEQTAKRALAIISILRAMSLFEELTAATTTVIGFYAGGLATCIGPDFKRPSLEVLGTRWFQASSKNELRPAIRTLFDATIASLSDEAAIEITEKWQHYVPALQPDAEKESAVASLALLICGCIASEKYSLLSVNTLTDLSKSVSCYLHDENSIYRVLAIELCSRGFHVWQHYVDAMEILRSLFNIATNSKKDSISIQNLGAQARLAILSITSNDMPFLMSTLCLDVLSPPTMEHRRSVLQVLAFLIKKRRFVLHSHLPKLMEAVVKSLDPNSTGNREMVLDAATEIISYVVRTYPIVCFHANSQRLAVGTNEGAVVMYDLRTAIRLYVLEGHKKAITACSFSPDGRRLVTLCLKESNVLVWKVGSSFASFFTPGAPPRQGHGGSEAFKTLNFHIGSDVEMTTEETLDLIRIEWITDRNVKVRIRQSVLTFST